MGIYLRQVSFAPTRTAPSQKPKDSLDALVTLTDKLPAGWFGLRFSAASGGDRTAATAQSLQAWCEARHIPCLLRTTRKRSGPPSLELCMGKDPALAERFGSAVREFLESDRSRYGISVTLRATARTPVLDRIERLQLSPLPTSAPPAWACAVQLLDGITIGRARSGSITEWAL